MPFPQHVSARTQEQKYTQLMRSVAQTYSSSGSVRSLILSFLLSVCNLTALMWVREEKKKPPAPFQNLKPGKKGLKWEVGEWEAQILAKK